jgi:hypothetical protein
MRGWIGNLETSVRHTSIYYQAGVERDCGRWSFSFVRIDVVSERRPTSIFGRKLLFASIRN